MILWRRRESSAYFYHLNHHLLDFLVREVDSQVGHDGLDLAAACKPTAVLVKDCTGKRN